MAAAAMLAAMATLGAAPAPAGARVQRPLDPREPNGPSISVYYEYYQHTAQGPSQGTLVATEGGPGYPATQSRDDYLALFAALRDHRDLLLMDNRGTGNSGAVNCVSLQRAARLTTQLIGACGRSLGDKAYLYSTALAADDLAAILNGLSVDKVDLYGDSYGTYFAQTFAVRHPEKLRSVVLDGAYPLNAPDYAWYPAYAPAMREKFNLSCRRSAHCSQLAGDSITHIVPALEALRRRPLAASAVNADGVAVSFTAGAAALATVMYGAAPAYATLRETDAAARAFSAGDTAPLLRLMADSITNTDSRDPSADPSQWSSGLAVAVMCSDAPQLFDMRAPLERRRVQFDQAIAARQRTHPHAYAPFTFDEYRGLPLDYAFIEQCLEWPPPLRAPPHPPSQVVAPDARYPDIPALVISGEYDNMTTVAEGAAVAAAFPHGRHVIIANSFHVNALPRARSPCAAQIVRRFVASLKTGDTSCAAGVPDLRLAPNFAVDVASTTAADALPGNQADLTALRCAAAAVRTAGDVVSRLHSNSSGHGVGLRGGTFSVTAARDDAMAHYVLDRVRWTKDLPVSGELSWGGQRGAVVAHLHFDRHGACESGTIETRWEQIAPRARARITGHIGQARLIADMEAP